MNNGPSAVGCGVCWPFYPSSPCLSTPSPKAIGSRVRAAEVSCESPGWVPLLKVLSLLIPARHWLQDPGEAQADAVPITLALLPAAVIPHGGRGSLARVSLL